MTRQVLEELLSRHGNVKVDGDTIHIVDQAQLSVYVGVGTEPLIIDRVAWLQLDRHAVIVATRRSEKYFVAYEDVRALRMSPKDVGAGYS
jgi:hypothetical protein